MVTYPSKVKKIAYGKSLVAAKDLPKGTIVEKFDGIIIKYKPGDMNPTPPEVPESEVCYFYIVDWETVVIPKTNARYINHSCEPNCDINSNREVYTLRPVKRGEELTFGYNMVEKGSDPGPWDPRWNFKCLCGSPICQGTIDKFVYREGDEWVQIGEIWNEPPATISDTET
ncbi:MAG TPA: SET domain-containing protein-lysine N-methyltransferase [Candidatus Lokiarchaeia archaeon]|nr:SET domain-containing protein-lysine N-methyltransferase [Candidatus Lokiarchaeia archaeon]